MVVKKNKSSDRKTKPRQPLVLHFSMIRYYISGMGYRPRSVVTSTLTKEFDVRCFVEIGLCTGSDATVLCADRGWYDTLMAAGSSW